jgi:hypothetical protein
MVVVLLSLSLSLSLLNFIIIRFRSLYERDILQFEELLNENAKWLNCADHTTVAAHMSDNDLITYVSHKKQNKTHTQICIFISVHLYECVLCMTMLIYLCFVEVSYTSNYDNIHGFMTYIALL